MSCKMKIEQMKEVISNGNEEVKSGIVFFVISQYYIQQLLVSLPVWKH